MNENHTEPTQAVHECCPWRRRGMFLPVVLIVLGVVLLAYKLDPVARAMIAQWWPFLFVILGVWLAAVRTGR